MVPVKNKSYFLEYIINKRYLINYELKEFFSHLIQHKEKLDKVKFYEGRASKDKKITCKLQINIQNNTIVLYVDNKKAKIADPFFYTLLYLDASTEGTVAIFFVDIYKNMFNIAFDCFENYYVVNNLVFDAFIDYLTNDALKKNAYIKINESLDEKDKDKFMLWSSIYNKL
jgi:hypothetical protein